jgi:hypothetical protein
MLLLLLVMFILTVQQSVWSTCSSGMMAVLL